MLRYPKSLALLAGLASATGFAPLNLWPLTLAMLALLMWLVARAPDLRSALARGWWFGLGHFTLGLNWIAHAFTYQDAMPHWLGYGAVVALSLYLALYPAAAAGLAWRWGTSCTTPPRHSRASGNPASFSFSSRSSREKKRAGSREEREGREEMLDSRVRGNDGLKYVLLFAAAWTVTEWLRASLFTGFAWNPLGVVWVQLPGVAMLARWIGTYGASALVVVAAGALLLAAGRRFAAAGAIAAAFAAAALLLPPGDAPELPATRPLVRIVQPNIGQDEKHEAGSEFVALRKLAQLSTPRAAEPRLLFWPEAAIDNRLRLDEQPDLRLAIADLLGPRDMLLTGGVALVYNERGELTAATNSLFALSPNARIVGRYDKAHLVPYGEYLPMRPLLSALGLSRLVPGDLDFRPGPGPQTLAIPGFGRVGVQICYEIIFSGQVVSDADRPDFIFNPSNDAWFGSWGPPQHLAQARLRAIEEGLPVVRSTPTGISALVDADGRLLASIPHHAAGVIDARLPRPHAPTLFAHFGNLLAVGFALLLAAIGVAIGRARR